mmetsp:Transcript_29478/g.79195  ORF Transcript_29478/g.79195 Transcript_29478/m.79195 type:complete len:386 (+) Transcript_29478:456-1613(+)
MQRAGVRVLGCGEHAEGCARAGPDARRGISGARARGREERAEVVASTALCAWSPEERGRHERVVAATRACRTPRVHSSLVVANERKVAELLAAPHDDGREPCEQAGEEQSEDDGHHGARGHGFSPRRCHEGRGSVDEGPTGSDRRRPHGDLVLCLGVKAFHEGGDAPLRVCVQASAVGHGRRAQLDPALREERGCAPGVRVHRGELYRVRHLTGVEGRLLALHVVAARVRGEPRHDYPAPRLCGNLHGLPSLGRCQRRLRLSRGGDAYCEDGARLAQDGQEEGVSQLVQGGSWDDDLVHAVRPVGGEGVVVGRSRSHDHVRQEEVRVARAWRERDHQALSAVPAGIGLEERHLALAHLRLHQGVVREQRVAARARRNDGEVARRL